MLPRKCLTECEVPYLCLMACPLNDRLDRLVLSPKTVEHLDLDPDEPYLIVIADESKIPLEPRDQAPTNSTK